ncbi:hypothetical protein V1478_006317 [Vespula squamosa]|uniref:Uncharacterized protein n=1 Tax=Vespula squamosa TaxID=30214 RepID=A0ABD2B7J6_VESSQ
MACEKTLCKSFMFLWPQPSVLREASLSSFVQRDDRRNCLIALYDYCNSELIYVCKCNFSWSEYESIRMKKFCQKGSHIKLRLVEQNARLLTATLMPFDESQ